MSFESAARYGSAAEGGEQRIRDTGMRGRRVAAAGERRWIKAFAAAVRS
ncbi:MAG: hypothetical protein OJF48_000148 [Afipia sp.]|nr:MAG: hypothetical protein OJF48_000148 [Afipia sp.]